eukprot:594327-Pleurochrysis_carterae.AAC.5
MAAAQIRHEVAREHVVLDHVSIERHVVAVQHRDRRPLRAVGAPRLETRVEQLCQVAHGRAIMNKSCFGDAYPNIAQLRQLAWET